MQKHKKEKVGVLPAVIFIGYLILSSIPDIVFQEILRSERPATYIGMDALHQIHDYLILYFFGRILIFFAPALPWLIAGMVIGFSIREEERKFAGVKLFMIIGLVFSLIFSTVSSTKRNGFEVQMKQNKYFGTALIKTASMIMDIEKDFKTEEIKNISAQCWVSAEDYGYTWGGGRGGRHHVSATEYKLSLNEDACQVSGKDREQIENLFDKNQEHEFAVYRNSGFLASVDEELLPADLNLETLFTLTYENDTIYRTEHPHEEAFDNLSLILELNGEQIGNILASGWTERFSPPMRGAGEYTAYLTMNYNGKKTRVSNEIHYQFDEENYTEPETEPCPELTGEITETDDGFHIRLDTYPIELDIPAILNLKISLENTELEEDASGYSRNLITGKGQFFYFYMEWEKLPYLKETKWRVENFKEYLEYQNPDAGTEVHVITSKDGTEGCYLIYKPKEINADTSDYYRVACVFPYGEQEYIWIESICGGEAFLEDAVSILESLHFIR